MSLLCPKCTNAMRQYERNDVIIDQCTECGGIFLDRGELERLAQAESNYYNPQGAQPLPTRHPDDLHADPRRDAPRRDDRPRYDDRERYGDRAPRYLDDRGYRDDRRRDDREYRDDYRRDRDDYDPRYGKGKYGKRKKKEGFLGELMDLL